MTDPRNRTRKRQYLADENFPRYLVEEMRAYGLDVVESREVSPAAADILLERIAADQQWVLLTQDRDFKASASRKSSAELRASAPTVLLRPSQGQAVTWLTAALPTIERHLDLAEREQWPLRIIRIKAGVVNIEITFDLVVAG